MLANPLAHFDEIWLVDFEFYQPEGERPKPICLVAREFRTNRLVRWCQEELSCHAAPPFDVSPNSLFVAYYASAELGCFLALGWQTPERILDLYVEFRCMTNGNGLPSGRGC